MAKNPDVMAQLQQEVDAAYDESDGKTPDYTVVQVILLSGSVVLNPNYSETRIFDRKISATSY